MNNEAQAERGFFSVVSRHPKIFLTSPLWLAAILILLSSSSQSLREVVEFMTTSPLR